MLVCRLSWGSVCWYVRLSWGSVCWYVRLSWGGLYQSCPKYASIWYVFPSPWNSNVNLMDLSKTDSCILHS